MAVRSALTKFLIVLVATAATLAGAEYTLRKMGFRPAAIAGNDHFNPDSKWGWAAPDPDTGWRNKPVVAISMEPGNVPMTFWEDGRRATRPDRPSSRCPRWRSWAAA